MAGGGVALVGITLIPLLSGLFGYGHSKGNTPDGEKPKAVRRTLKTEYHSLGQNNETSVIRGPAIKKAGWLKKPMWSVGASPHLPRCIPNPTGVEDK